MMGTRKITILISIMLLLGVANAQLFGSFCSDLFSGTLNGGNGPINAADIQLMSISIIIVIFVLSALGIIYAIGYGFGIESLKTFTKTEFMESIFNLALIAITASGIGFAGGGIAFISNIAGIGLQSSGLQTPSTAISSVLDLDLVICSNYVDKGVAAILPSLLGTTGTAVALASIKSVEIKLAPDYLGFIVQPFAGIGPVITIINIELGFFMTMVAMLFSAPLLLYLIYYLFPVFFYAGLFLRSFPWTRAAGGSFIALFIAFYIVFPALMYPFSFYSVEGFATLAVSSMSSFVFSLSSVNIIGSMLFSVLPGQLNPLIFEISGFGSVVGGLAVELLGLVVSLIISLDFVEVLGDLLGAPSLHTKKLLSKVI